MNPPVFKIIKIIMPISMAIVFLSGCALTGSSTAPSAESALSRGQASLSRADLQDALHQCRQAAEVFSLQGNISGAVSARLCEAEAYSRLGQYDEAEKILLSCLKAADKPEDRAAVSGSLGQTYFHVGDNKSARHYLEAGLNALKTEGHAELSAALLNSLGNLCVSDNTLSEAFAYYREALQQAEAAGNALQAVRVRINSARAHLASGKVETALPLIEYSLKQLPALPEGHETMYLYLASGRLLQQIQSLNANRTYDHKVEAAFASGIDLAERMGDATALSYAYGYMATLRQEQARYEEALSLSRKAVFIAQQEGALKSLYRWQWLIGRIHHDEGRRDEAITAYRLAVSSLQDVRNQMATGCKRGICLSFKETVGPVYFELADLLLQRSAKATDSKAVQFDLQEARSTIELLKAAELQDYFQDECVTALRSGSMDLDRLDAKTVAIYPVVLPDRVELIVTFPDTGLRQFTVPVEKTRLENVVSAFRRKIQDPLSRPLRQGKQLYDWFICPYSALLREKGINTLIFIPDGILRTIPLSALHDGNAFLIEQYAVVTSPGLSLTDPHPLKRNEPRLLVGAITESVQGFSALPSVSLELNQLGRLYAANVLKNENFKVDQLEMDLKESPYSIVHIASHGQFDSDAKKTFILAYDEKIGMDRLEKIMGISKYRNEPVELLTLSACETALGDDRAALGLAGVALKAGARSAIASLWFVDDRATSELIVYFYKQLREHETSKAKALQSAQLELIRKADTRHPAFWAPFLLVGNWL